MFSQILRVNEVKNERVTSNVVPYEFVKINMCLYIMDLYWKWKMYISTKWNKITLSM